jgi:uncharacterized membrane protein YGL010W
MAFDLQAYLAKYREDHQHPVNKALHTVGIPTIIASLAVVPFNPLLGASMFVAGWILQFVGHAFEGKWPSFFSDPKFLLVGAAWFVKKATGKGSAPAPDASAN